MTIAPFIFYIKSKQKESHDRKCHIVILDISAASIHLLHKVVYTNETDAYAFALTDQN